MRDMTQGSISKHLLSYAVPMIMGNILQLTYNAIDSIIVGKFAGEEALAAVSVSNPIMTLVTLGVSGISLGASVLMSKFFGAKEIDKLKRELSTTILSGTIASIAICILGMIFSRRILQIMSVPNEALDMASSYLRIVFIGFLFTFQYNVISSALRSVGDSRTPVMFLCISSVLNCFLDVVFIYYFRMGVASAGLATVIAQAFSVVLCMTHVYRTQDVLKLGIKDLIIDKSLLGETLKIGSLTALQQASQPVGKVLIQSVINCQGVASIAAFNAVCRMDDFACIPAQSIGHSIMTFVAQNRGAKQAERINKGFKHGLVIALIYYPIICGITLLLKEPFVKLLSPRESSKIVAMGVSYLSIKAWIFIMPCILNAIQGYFRGMADMKIVLFSTLIQITLRTILVYHMVPSVGINGEAYACLIGWIFQTMFEYGYYYLKRRKV